MILKNYKYGNTEFAIDISRIPYIGKDGGRSIIIFLERAKRIFITFDSYREREKAYEDILRDIEELYKPPVSALSNIAYKYNVLRDSVMTKPTALTENPYLYTDPDLRMKSKEDE